MKKLIKYAKKPLIIFIFIAYIFPFLCFPIVTLPKLLRSNETITHKTKEEIKLFASSTKENKEFLNKDNLEKFSDKIFAEQLKKFNVPGAVISIVKGNSILFEKGYGYSDLDKKTPVDAKKTIFRAASVSKPFTATAVMQLKEKGKVNLQEDINPYLNNLKIENKYSKAITLENLLTHTAGFDEKIIGESKILNSEKEKSLRENLIYHTHPVIREPGEAPQYSNYGMALAGHIVENISGSPFNKYMEDNIFKPLNMNNSSFEFDNKTLNNLCEGYDYKNNVYKKVPITIEAFAPAGGLKTTADDMAKFMIANLNKGTYNNTNILNKTSIEDMHKKHFPSDINIGGVCYGFSERYINGIRLIEHGGDLYGFHSKLYLIPDTQLGIFISTNGENGSMICGGIADEFINKFYPKSEAVTTLNNETNFTKSNLKKLEGCYQTTRYPRRDIGKLVLLMFPAINVKSTSDSIIIKYPGGQDVYKEIQPLLFKNVEKGDLFTFKLDKQGNPRYLINEGSSVALEKIHLYENPSVHKIIFAVFLVLFLIMFVSIIFSIFKKRASKENSLCNYHRYICIFICTLNLIFLFGMAKECINLSSTIMFIPEVPKLITRLLYIPIVTSIIAFVLMIFTYVNYNIKKINLNFTIRSSLVCFFFLLFNLFLNYWNLLGFKF